MSQIRIADSLDLSSKWIGKIYQALEAKDLIERRKNTREDTAVRTKDEWNEWFMADKADIILGMKTGSAELSTVVPRKSDNSSHPRNKVLTPCEQSSYPWEQSSYNTNNYTKLISKDIYIPFLELWNKQQVVIHRQLTKGMEKEFEKCCKEFTEDEIKHAVEVYGEVVRGEQYYFKHKWTLEEFLARKNGLRVFVYKKPEDYLEFKSNKPESLSGAEYFAKMRDQNNQ
jgi:hypothetical protein